MWFDLTMCHLCRVATNVQWHQAVHAACVHLQRRPVCDVRGRQRLLPCRDGLNLHGDDVSMATTRGPSAEMKHMLRYFTLMNPGTLLSKNVFFFRNDYRHGNVHATRLQISKTMHKLDLAGRTGMDVIHTWRWHGGVILSTDTDAMPVISHANRGTSDNRKTAVDKWLPLWGAQ